DRAVIGNVEFHDAYFLASQRVGVVAIAAGDVPHRGEHAIAVARQPFRGFAAEAARSAGDENSLGHGLPPVMRVRGQCEMISRYGWSGTGGVPRPGCPRASLNRRRERRVGGDEALDASQKANSRLACATNFPEDANETRVSVKADALPKRNTSALT